MAFFGLLLIASMVGIVASLVAPGVLSKIAGRDVTRKQGALFFAGIFLLVALVNGVIFPPAENKQIAVEGRKNDVAPAQVVTATATSDLVANETPVETLPAVVRQPIVPPVALGTSTVVGYAVTRVVDGDTFDVDVDGKIERIRMIGVDTPETVDPRKPVQCFGKEASAKTGSLIAGKRVTLEADATQGERDKYGRLLRYVFLPDGQNLGLVLIQEGYAHEYTYDLPYKYQQMFRDAEKTAREEKKGLWADDACVSQPTTTTSVTSTSSVTSPGSASGDPAVKKSTSGICHERGSKYYDKTTNFVAYASLKACLDSGGRLPK